MKLDSLWFAAVVVAIIILIGQWSSKVAYTLAAVILLGAILLNIGHFQKLMKGDFSA